MVNGILGKKIGMTRIFADGQSIPVTVIEAGTCYVTQKKTIEKDGYEAIQLGFGVKKDSRVNKPMAGHFKKAGTPATYKLKEFKAKEFENVSVGSEINCNDIFAVGDFIDVEGTSKGKGFAGVMKRHGFGGGRASHGSHFHRSTGAIGMCADPSRVFKGTRMPGQMGNKRITTQSLKVVDINEEDNIILIKGTVPGPINGVVSLTKALRK